MPIATIDPILGYMLTSTLIKVRDDLAEVVRLAEVSRIPDGIPTLNTIKNLLARVEDELSSRNTEVIA